MISSYSRRKEKPTYHFLWPSISKYFSTRWNIQIKLIQILNFWILDFPSLHSPTNFYLSFFHLQYLMEHQFNWRWYTWIVISEEMISFTMQILNKSTNCNYELILQNLDQWCTSSRSESLPATHWQTCLSDYLPRLVEEMWLTSRSSSANLSCKGRTSQTNQWISRSTNFHISKATPNSSV